MKILTLLCFILISGNLYASDFTGNYTGCGELSSLGNRQAVLVLVKMPTGFGESDFRYTGGFYWKGNAGADFFTDVQIDESTNRILMRTEIKPLHDFGVIAKTVEGKIIADGSIQGIFLTNSTGADGRFQTGTFTVEPFHLNALPDLKCGK